MSQSLDEFGQREGMSMQVRETHEEIIRRKGLPRVGQTVRSKKYGTLWRVMEKREVWRNIADDPVTGEYRMIPCIYLNYWRVTEGESPGSGKTMGFLYTLYDESFEKNWEIVEE